ncbi:MAG: sialate O-acetylesterase, partial [Verrucomicrobiota bacterium]
MNTRKAAFIGIGICLLTWVGRADDAIKLRISNAFHENMVFQQEAPIRVWGVAAPKASVHVQFGDDKTTVQSDDQGHWLAEFKAREAGFEPLTLTVRSGDEEAKPIRNILIGEVWLCGGQSNMAPAGHENADLEWPSADGEFVRYTMVESKISPKPLLDLDSRSAWMPLVESRMELRRVSPVAYYFGLRLQRFLKVPVGIINTAVGGTTAEVWASRESQVKHPELAALIEARGDDIGAFYNGTIEPLSRFSVRGCLFYQGENNTFEGYETYAYSFPCVIRDWREAFGDPDLPFGIISLAGNKGMSSSPEPEGELTHRHSYTHIRDVHFRTFRSTKNTGLITIHDLGADNMHPGRKRDVGERSARWALATAYGYGKKSPREGGVYHTAPVYREHNVDGNKMLLYFDYDPTIDDVRSGKWYKRLPLPDRAREYRGFIVAGANRQFFPAQVKVRSV